MHTPPHASPIRSFQTVCDVDAALRAYHYLPTEEVSTAVLLASRLDRALLVEGPAGTGKTSLATALAHATDRRIVRLQCHEAIDESRAVYEWDYRKQLLHLQAADSAHSAGDVFGEDYLLVRPLLDAVRSSVPVLLLIDEVDRLSIEAEALLLEVLAEQQISIPEFGTVTAVHTPLVVLTSNNTRELSEALRRRCLFLHLGYPSPEREREIVLDAVPDLEPRLAEQLTVAVAALRALDLRKKPSVAETLDWARSFEIIPSEQVTAASVIAALPLLLKNSRDIATATEALLTS